MFPGGGVGYLESQGIVTYEQHIMYLDYLEIIRHAWLCNIDFVENFEALHVPTWIGIQGQQEYNALLGIYNTIMSNMNPGISIEESMGLLEGLINELEVAIMLEDDTYVNPWSTSEWENDEEVNQ